ncbi:MAG: tRNA lysidine(34) synthetase TilS [Propionibacteriaceae bacterium]
MAVRELGPASLRVVRAVRAQLDSTEVALVACSGGPDSLALAAALAHVAGGTSVLIAGACVDHGLQPGSAAQATTTVAQLVALGFPVAETLRADVDRTNPAGPEAAARHARYAALDAAADRLGATTILLGHTRDDQAETVLLGLARGSGTRSLAGMASRNGRYGRPLLELPRRDTVTACAEWGLTPWADPHNGDPRYARVRVRARVLPVLEAELGPGIDIALARTAELARADADLLDALAADADPGTAELAVELLVDLPAALRSRVLRRWLLRIGSAEVGLDHVRAVAALVTDWHGQRGVDLPGLRIVRRSGNLSGRHR